MFIGRETELHFLHERYQAEGGQLIVLYGRRRVGKTETLREFCKGKPHVFYSCTQTTDQVQLLKFSDQLMKEDIPAKKYVSRFADWEQAFRAICELPYGEKKKLVVIDEFPYLCKTNPSIPSILQNLWDTELKDRNVMMILCGSAMSFIEKDLLAEKNPLYGRATGIYKMTEMDFYDAVKFFPYYSDEEKVLTYAVLGGIPHYLKQWEPKLTPAQNIKKHILTKGCVLYSEVDFLLHQELRETPIYNSIIEAVALGSTTLNEISQKSLLNHTAKTSVYLKNLMELGIIEKEFSVDAELKQRANAAKGVYHLTDNFFRFWYAFGFANFSQLEDGDAEGVYAYVIKPALQQFVSMPFENICRTFIKKLQKQGKLPFRYVKIGRWMGKTTVRDVNTAGGLRTSETEIDILCIGPDHKEYLVGECNYKNSAFTYAEYLDTRAKLAPMKQDTKFYYALFSKNGFDEKILAEAKNNTLKLYDLHEIVSGATAGRENKDR